MNNGILVSFGLLFVALGFSLAAFYLAACAEGQVATPHCWALCRASLATGIAGFIGVGLSARGIQS